jgi:membrane protein
MALDTTPGSLRDDAERRPGHDGPRIPLWMTALGAALLAVGFRLGQYAGRYASVEDAGETSAHRAAAAVIRRRTWKDVLFCVYDDIGKHRVVAMAAGVTFYSMLALFPAIAALVSLYGLFSDPDTIASHLDMLAGVLPGGAVEVIGDELKRVSAQPNNTLGFAFALGLGTALWSANAGIKALFDVLNLVHDEPESRGLISLNAQSLAFTAAAIGFVLLALGAVVVLPIALDYVGIAMGADQVIRWLRWPGLLLVVMLGLSLLYRFGPSRSPARWRLITWGSAIAAALWLLASVLFSWYAADFGSYNKTYGSLGAVIGFMVWIWISTIVMLVGAEIDVELGRPAARNATVALPDS